jgi:hypothetical protein
MKENVYSISLRQDPYCLRKFLRVGGLGSPLNFSMILMENLPKNMEQHNLNSFLRLTVESQICICMLDILIFERVY